MSIAAMKRKALRRPISGGAAGFSINGGHRNTGNVTHSARLQRTGYKCSANDSSIVKPSVKTTKGHLSKKHLCCNNIVQTSRAGLDYTDVVAGKCNVVDTGNNIGTTCPSNTCGSKTSSRGTVVKNQSRTVPHSEYLRRIKGQSLTVPASSRSGCAS